MILTAEDENELPMGSTLCLLCNGIVAYKGEDRDRFYNHMKHQHGAYFNLEFIKAGCLMDEDEKTAVIGIMERKETSIENEGEEGDETREEDEKLLTEEDYMEVIEENESKNGDKRKCTGDINVEENVKISTEKVVCDRTRKESGEALKSSQTFTSETNISQVIRNDEKYIESLSDELKQATIDKYSSKKGGDQQLLEIESNINDGKEINIKQVSKSLSINPLLTEVKLRELKVDIPLLNFDYLKLLMSSEEESEKVMEEEAKVIRDAGSDANMSEVKDFILGNALPKIKEQRRKVFSCNICSKEFSVTFHNLVRHKMKIHKISKKDAKVISMQHVRYEKVASIDSVSEKVSVYITEKDSVLKKNIKDELVEEVNSITQEPSSVDDPVQTCALCKLKVASVEKFKAHMNNRHGVSALKSSLFAAGEESLAQLEKDNAENKNKCKICDTEHDNLGKLWNHYKRTHKVKKDTIKSLISKSKCTICAAQVTFIGDHYRTFHRFEKDNIPPLATTTTKPLVKTEVATENNIDVSKDSRSKPDHVTPVKNNEEKGAVEEPQQFSDEELIAKLPTGSLTQFPQFFEEMKKYYPGKSEKEIKLKTIQMFKKVRLENQDRESPILKGNLKEYNLKTPQKLKPLILTKIKEEPLSIQDPVSTHEISLKNPSMLESVQIKIERESEPRLTSVENLKVTKSYNCTMCETKVPHLWNHYRDYHNMSKEEFKAAMQSVRKKNEQPINLYKISNQKDDKTPVEAMPGIRVDTEVVKQSLPELGLKENELTQELFIIDGNVGKGYLCNYCDFTCNRKENLNIHTQLKHADNLRKEADKCIIEEVKVECEPCNLVLSKDELELHKKIVHSIFTCDDCEVTFTSRKEFRNHTIMHMMDSEVQTLDVVMNNQQNVVGDDCAKDFLKKKMPVPKNLKEEPTDEYFYCDDCDFSSNRECDYRKHVEKDHVEKYPTDNLSGKHAPQVTPTLSLVPQANLEINSTKLKTMGFQKKQFEDKNVEEIIHSSVEKKTECPVCNRQVNFMEAHMKRNHPELEKIRDTPLYQEIIADKSLAYNAPNLKLSNFHKPSNNSEYITKLKEKISKDIEPTEKLNESQVVKPGKDIMKGRVITINNTAMLLEECSLCHQKVLYLSQHIQDVHGMKENNKHSENVSVANNVKEMNIIRKQIKKENNMENDDSGNGEYVANLISKLKDFDSEDDEDDPKASLDEQDVADTMDLIDDPNKHNGSGYIEILDNEANDGLKLIDIDPKKLYDQAASQTLTLSNPKIGNEIQEENIQIKSESMGTARIQQKYNPSLDHLPLAMAESLRNSKYFQEHPSVLKKIVGKENLEKTYQEDPNLLPGWKVKFYPRPADGNRPSRSDRVFLTPENMQIRSTFGVFEYMRCSGQYTASQIKHVTTYLRMYGGKKYK